MKVGRNDLCPCGSGQKFKKCCIPRYEYKPKPEPKPQFRRKESPELLLFFAQLAALAEPPDPFSRQRRLPPTCLEDLE